MSASAVALMAIQKKLEALAIARSTEADEDTLAVYVGVLSDLAPSLVGRACERLARLPRRSFEAALPDVGTIREACAEIEREDRAAVADAKLLPPAPGDSDPRTWMYCPEVPACRDTGWVDYGCPGVGTKEQPYPPMNPRCDGFPTASCGRSAPHASHSYVVACRCRDINPKLNQRPAHAGAA